MRAELIHVADFQSGVGSKSLSPFPGGDETSATADEPHPPLSHTTFFLPSFLSFPFSGPCPSTSICFIAYFQTEQSGRQGRGERPREGGRERDKAQTVGRFFCLFSSFSSRRRMGRSLLCHPHSPSSPRRVVHAAFYCALSFEAKSSPCDAWDDMSFNTRGMGTLFRVLQMINSF